MMTKRLGTLFTPTPSTYSTLAYWTGRDPFTGKACFVEKSARGREKQKEAVTGRDAKMTLKGRDGRFKKKDGQRTNPKDKNR